MGQTQKFGGFTTNIDDILDDDTMATASATTLATSESIKAYVDANAGGGAFSDWSSIGTGGDYADVQAMLTALKYKGYLLSNVTEDSVIAPDANGLYLHLNNFILTMGDNNIVPSAACNITIEGFGPSSEIDYTSTTEKQLISTGAFTTCVTTLDNFKYDNNSAEADTHLVTSTSEVHITMLTIEPPNLAAVSGSPIGIEIANIRSYARDIVVVSGGTSTRNVIQGSEGSLANLHMIGAFSATITNPTISIGGGSTMVVNGVVSTAAFSMLLSAGCAVSNVSKTGGTANIALAGSDIKLSNVNYSTGTSTIDVQNADDWQIDNVQCGTLDLTDAGSLNGSLTNSWITAAVTIAGDYHKISNNPFDGALTVSAGAVRNILTGNSIVGAVSISDQTIMTGNRVGAVAGGGAVTITVAAGTGTVLTGNITDAAISDSGTDTVLNGNSVY